MSNSATDTIASPKKFFYGWYVVIAGLVGISFSYSVVAVMASGTWMRSLIGSFGWTRTEVTFGITVIGISAMIAFPIAGRLMDRIGARGVLIPSTLALAIVLSSMYFLTGDLWQYYLMCALLPIAGCGSAPMGYSRVLINWFNKRRGLALGIALAGVGVGSNVVPRLAASVIEGGMFGIDLGDDNFRLAYVAVGMAIAFIGLPVIYFFYKETPEEMGLLQDNADHKAEKVVVSKDKVGFVTKDSSKTKHFWYMVTSFMVTGFCTAAIIIHMIPMMMERGFSIGQAAALFGNLGIGLILARVTCGYLMDKIFAPYVVTFFLVLPVIGIYLLAGGATGATAGICAGLVGAAIGAEFDVMGFFVSRYFGPRSFGEINGWMYSAYKLGACTGPLFVAVLADHFGQYSQGLYSLSGIMVLGVIFVAIMPKYPTLPVEKAVNGH